MGTFDNTTVTKTNKMTAVTTNLATVRAVSLF